MQRGSTASQYPSLLQMGQGRHVASTRRYDSTQTSQSSPAYPISHVQLLGTLQTPFPLHSLRYTSNKRTLLRKHIYRKVSFSTEQSSFLPRCSRPWSTPRRANHLDRHTCQSPHNPRVHYKMPNLDMSVFHSFHLPIPARKCNNPERCTCHDPCNWTRTTAHSRTTRMVQSQMMELRHCRCCRIFSDPRRLPSDWA